MSANVYGLDPAFPGMKADAGDDRVETVAAAGPIPFGAVVSYDANWNGVAGSTGATNGVAGVAVHSHAITTPGYVVCDAVSVMRRGLIWGLVGTGKTCTKGGQAKFDLNGLFADDGANTYKNATFRETQIATDYGLVVLVELHDPVSETTGA